MDECDGLDFLTQLRAKMGEDELSLAITMARFIWMRQNDFIFRNQFTPPLVLFRQAEESVRSFAMATKNPSDSGGGRESAPCRWSPLSAGWLKCNWDAAINKPGKRMGVGVVIGDDQGKVVAALAKTFFLHNGFGNG